MSAVAVERRVPCTLTRVPGTPKYPAGAGTRTEALPMTLHRPCAQVAIEWLIVRGQIRKMVKSLF